MFEPDAKGVYAEVGASPARRGFAFAVLALLGLLPIWLALTQPAGFGGKLALLVIGGASLGLAARLWQATALTIRLTEAGLEQSDGRRLADFDDIRAVERGVFALKPSNGFSVLLYAKGQRGWAPGLWWRAGRRIGVGGALPSGPAKYMAEALAFRIAARDAALAAKG